MNYPQLYHLLPKPPQKWSTPDIPKFLKYLHLQPYTQTFTKAGIDGSCLRSLTYKDLNEELGIASRIVCKKIMNWVGVGLAEFQLFVSKMQEQEQQQEQEQEEERMRMGLRLGGEGGDEPMVSTQKNDQTQKSPKILQPSTQSTRILLLKKPESPQTLYYRLPQTPTKLGSHQSSQIQVQDPTQTILPHHAQITYRNHHYYLRNVDGSAVFVKVMKRVPVYQGMRVEMGENVFRFGVDGDRRVEVGTVDGSKNQNYVFKFSTMRNKILIGRKSTNHISFPQDITLSNLHSRLTYSDYTWYLQDLATTNGTWVQLDSQTKITQGLTFKLGLTNLIFQCQLRHLQPSNPSSSPYSHSSTTTTIYQQKSNDFCQKCQKNIKNIIFTPCNHCTVCEDCCEEVTVCGVCARRVGAKVKIYKS